MPCTTNAHRRFSITDPRFNLREILKQMVLLEQHLNDPDKRCPECICKHLLTIEALTEEAISLDAKNAYPWLPGLSYFTRKGMNLLLHDHHFHPDACIHVSKLLRGCRKALFQAYIRA